jgi:hypothetical protein
MAIHAEKSLDVVWIDLDGASQVLKTDLGARAIASAHRPFEISAAADGVAILSVAVADAKHPLDGWTITDPADRLYRDLKRWPFDDHEYETECLTRTTRRWSCPGRAASVADEVVVFEEAAHLVGRRVADAGELWRLDRHDQFVLGTIAMPAWSDDRVYVVDRGDRRRAAWAREAAAANIHGLDMASMFQRASTARLHVLTREQQYLAAPSILRCLSTKTGDQLWQARLDGDIVSFHAHAKWVACMVGNERGDLHVWRHDGTLVAKETPAVGQPIDRAWWPPDPSRWPCIVSGDDDHVLVIQNGHAPASIESRLYQASIEAPATPVWQTTLPGPFVNMPLFRWFRLLNRVPIAFVTDGAVLRWGKNLHGLLPS